MAANRKRREMKLVGQHAKVLGTMASEEEAPQHSHSLSCFPRRAQKYTQHSRRITRMTSRMPPTPPTAMPIIASVDNGAARQRRGGD